MSETKKQNLSEKNVQTLDLLCDGKTAKEIAALQNLSPRTVEHHTELLKARFACTTIGELTSKWTRLKILGTAA